MKTARYPRAVLTSLLPFSRDCQSPFRLDTLRTVSLHSLRRSHMKYCNSFRLVILFMFVGVLSPANSLAQSNTVQRINS